MAPPPTAAREKKIPDAPSFGAFFLGGDGQRRLPVLIAVPRRLRHFGRPGGGR